ncbi:MAG TPA: hypothetical protein VFM24_02890 [Nitrospira sp.]|nr:hypothetical protein [Nitrospira sp.]
MITKYMAIGMAVLVALLGVAGFLLKRAYAENGALEAKLSNAQAIIDQREIDAKENAKAVAQLAEKLATTETKVVTVTERIYSAPKTTVCPEQPAIRAAIGSLPDIYAPAIPATDRRQPASALPAAAAPAKRAK